MGLPIIVRMLAVLAFLSETYVLAQTVSHPPDLAVGDSLAVGVGPFLHAHTVARIGASSCAIAAFAPADRFGRAVISAGWNDPPGRCIGRIRARLNAERVVWIAPMNDSAQTVRLTADLYGDVLVSYRVGPDGIHPASYAELAEAVRRAWR